MRRQRSFLAGHEVDFGHAVAPSQVEALKPDGQHRLVEAGVQVVTQGHGMALGFVHLQQRDLVALVGRAQAEYVALGQDGRQARVILHGLPAEGQLIGAELAHVKVIAELAHQGHVGAEFQGVLAVLVGDVAGQGVGGKEVEETPLNEDPLEGVGVVRSPKIGEILQPAVVGARRRLSRASWGRAGIWLASGQTPFSYGDNPYYAKARVPDSISGPHAGQENIWPMSVIIRAMTSNRDEDILASLKTLKATHAGTGFMHESFNKDDASQFTRKWFAWANTLFGEFLVRVADEKPQLLSKLA